MLTAWTVLAVIWILAAWATGYWFARYRARVADAESEAVINQLVQEQLAARRRAAFYERQAQEYHRLWQLWQRTAFQWARQGWPDQRAYIDEQEAKLATNNLLIVTRANYHAPRPQK